MTKRDASTAGLQTAPFELVENDNDGIHDSQRKLAKKANDGIHASQCRIQEKSKFTYTVSHFVKMRDAGKDAHG